MTQTDPKEHAVDVLQEPLTEFAHGTLLLFAMWLRGQGYEQSAHYCFKLVDAMEKELKLDMEPKRK